MQTAATAATVRRLMRCGLLGLVAALLLAALALAPPVTSVRAATMVTNCNDSGAGSLRDAITNAAAGDTVNFAQDCTDTNTITLTGSLTPTVNVTIDATVGNRTVTMGGNNAVQLFIVNSGVTLGLRGLTLTGGNVGNVGNGGRNRAIFNSGTVTITGSTFSGNFAGAGGAIYNNGSGTLTVTGSTFANNNAGIVGGAIFNSGTVNIMGSTFSGNSADNGGAIYNDGGGMLTVTGSTFANNNTVNGGGAIINYGTLTVTNSTFANNGANHGGAIYNNGGGTLTLTLSVAAGNSAPYGGPDIFGTVTTDGGGNVVGDTSDSSGLTATSDRTGTAAAPLDPLLGRLANYGGPVQTLALLPGSPAIDILACPTGNGSLTTDARGVSRPQGANCDAGAFESQGFTVSALTGNNQRAPLTTTFAAPVGLTLMGTGTDLVAGGQITFTITPGSGGASATFGTLAGCTVTGGTVAVCTIPIGTSVATSPTFTANSVAGGFTIVATATGVPTTTFTETVIPGPATTFTVTGCPSPILSGTPCTVTVTAQDTAGNTATGYTGAVAITSSDGRAILPANATLTNGVGTFSVTLHTPGPQSITATDTVTGTITGSETGITVTGTAPTATNDGPYTVAANATLTVPAATGVLANDTKGNPQATISANTQPAHGSVTVNADGSFTYTPTTNYVGADSFTYTLTNSVGTSTGTVNLTVTGTAPTATNDGPYTVTTGTTLTVNAAQGVLTNDTKGNPQATISGNTQPAHGSVTVNADGSFTYTPTAGYVGNDRFTYTLTNAAGSSTGTVNITVTAATVTSLTTTAPTGVVSGNTGTATNPVLALGGKLTLGTTAAFSNGTTGPTSGLSYTSSNPGVASVDPTTGVVTANTGGTAMITVTGPNGSRTTITITVPTTAGTGLMPLPQPMAHPGAAAVATGMATPQPQPTAHPAGSDTGTGGTSPATPVAQPGRH